MAAGTTPRRLNFLPQGAGQFLRRRAVEAGGLVLLAAGLLLAAVLAGYHPDDPSLNTASSQPVRNWLGPAGAFAADLLLQGFGIAAVLPAAALGVWGWRVLTHRGLHRPAWRAAALGLAMAATAGAAQWLRPPPEWPTAGGFGGLVGHALRTLAEGPLAGSGPLAATLALPVLAAVAIAALALALQLAPRDGFHALLGVFRLGRLLGRGTWRAGREAARATRAAVARVERREPRLVGRPAAAGDEAPATADGTAAPEAADDLRPVPRLRAEEDPAAAGRVAQRARRARRSQRADTEEQPELGLGEASDTPSIPPLALLQPPDERAGRPQVDRSALEQNARLLESVLDDYGIRGEILEVRPGPVVTLYELEPAPGTKTSRVIGLADDIARSMSAVSVRVATVPGRSVIGIELPNRRRETVYLRELLSTQDYESGSGALALALGKDIGGTPIYADLAKMPHLLIAGTTGSGKSVAINTMILSLLYRLPPERCRLILIDPKMLELSVYDDIPHLLAPVVTDPKKAVVALKWAVREMENRYRAMARLGVRNIAGYNARLEQARAAGEELKRTVQTGFDPGTGKPVYEEEPLDMEPLPNIVVVVDEMADLMMVAGKEIEGAIQRLAQMARAAGIHLIMATQRPSVDVITGTIKANFPTRISFQVTSKIDSRTILGEQGAEQLLGQGDMLYMAGGGRISRVHGPFVSDQEVERIAQWLRERGKPEYLDAVTEEVDEGGDGGLGETAGALDSGDDLLDRAIDIVARHQKASTSFLQRQLQIGYNRAATLMEKLEEEGVVGPANHVGRREILVRRPDEER